MRSLFLVLLIAASVCNSAGRLVKQASSTCTKKTEKTDCKDGKVCGGGICMSPCERKIKWAIKNGNEKKWTFLKANKKNGDPGFNEEWYGYPEMKEVVGVPLSKATNEDFQRIFKCRNNEKCKGVDFPTTCSKPPCDTCSNDKPTTTTTATTTKPEPTVTVDQGSSGGTVDPTTTTTTTGTDTTSTDTTSTDTTGTTTDTTSTDTTTSSSTDIVADCTVPDTDFSGNDLNSDQNDEDYGAGAGRRDSVSQCQALCQLRTGCEFFTYKTAYKQCWLKTSNSNSAYESGAISGPKICGTDTTSTGTTDTTTDTTSTGTATSTSTDTVLA